MPDLNWITFREQCHDRKILRAHNPYKNIVTGDIKYTCACTGVTCLTLEKCPRKDEVPKQ